MDDDRLLKALLVRMADLTEEAALLCAATLPSTTRERLRVFATLSRSGADTACLAQAADVIVRIQDPAPPRDPA